MACIHGYRPDRCDKKHSKLKISNVNRSIGYLLTHNEMPNYITKYQDDYKSISNKEKSLE